MTRIETAPPASSGDFGDLGWRAATPPDAACASGLCLARVAAVDRDKLLLVDPEGTFRGKLAGGYRHRHADPLDLPCVGDWVCVACPPGDGLAVVHALLARHATLRRKSAGESVDYQVIAANVDCVVVVQSCHFDFNLKRLERYLVMARAGGAEALILLTKTDLVAPEVLAAQLDEIRAAGIAEPVVALSNVTEAGIESLRQAMRPGLTYCFVGSSGVGKSTLINRLLGGARQETGGVSGTGEGRHTTVRRELIRLEGGALVIDNPGMREFGVLGAAAGLDDRYADIADHAARCRYRDCSHAGEPGCAVRAAVESGELSREHVENYEKLKQEAAYNQMSYADKRHKDRAFGRFIKSVKKGLRDDSAGGD
jgi:ribosome biogenesis GTPase